MKIKITPKTNIIIPKLKDGEFYKYLDNKLLWKNGQLMNLDTGEIHVDVKNDCEESLFDVRCLELKYIGGNPVNKKFVCSMCMYFFGVKDLPIGFCANRNSDHNHDVLTHSHLPCEFFCNKDEQSKESIHEVIIYGGTKKQIEKQLSCNHNWNGPCMDNISRYSKCTKCYCIMRDMSEKEYYETIDMPDGEP